jgi:glyoxylase-like metal-dependent hydrolase (beta-lactamase superfamily II)
LVSDSRRPVIRAFTGGSFGQNGFVVHCEDTREAILIDPGASVGAMLEAVRVDALMVTAIVLTHAHLDHIEGVAAAKRATRAPVHLHPDDEILYQQAPLQAQMFGVDIEVPPPLDEYLRAREDIRIGEVALSVRYTPGHSPGHVIFVGEGVAIVGDCVFAGSIGRTDLPGGDFQTLMNSIRREILTLPDDTILYPGHGPASTVGHEKVSNPFLAPQFGGSGFA